METTITLQDQIVYIAGRIKENETWIDLVSDDPKAIAGWEKEVAILRAIGTNLATLNGLTAGEPLRIVPEQINADNNLLNNLQARLNDWKVEIEWTKKELIEQAFFDAKAGFGKSSRYGALEKSYQQLTANIKEAEQKLGKVEHRVSAPANPAFTGLVNGAIENLK